MSRFIVRTSFGTAALVVAAFPLAAIAQLRPTNPSRMSILTRPTLGHYVADRDEYEWRAREVLGAIADGSLKLEIGGRSEGVHAFVVPVPGAKQERWVTENAAATNLRLTARDLTELAQLPAALGSWD